MRHSNYSSWVEISKSALLHNLKQFIEIGGKNTKICPILKANAYGHDCIKIAKILQDKPIWGLGVVNLEEAELLRNFGFNKKPIIVLSYVNNDLSLGVKNNIIFPIYNLPFAKALDSLAHKLKKKAKVHLKIDIGTSRLGVRPEEALNFFDELKKLKNLNIDGIFAHFADSENNNWAFTRKQLKIFNETISAIEKSGFNFKTKHVACSAAALGSEETHFDLIRLGISLYGLWPSQAALRKTLRKYPRFNLKPVLTWHTKVIQIKNLPKGSSIGYSCTYKTNKPTKIAVIATGYFEGYDRHLSNKGEVLIKGRRCRVLGRVCMNMTMVDVTKVNSLRVGERVTLIGSQGKNEISADELAGKIGTINYEVVTRINPLIPRIYG